MLDMCWFNARCCCHLNTILTKPSLIKSSLVRIATPMICRLTFVISLTLTCHATTAVALVEECQWAELFPPPPHGCTRLFHRADRPPQVHEATAFLLFAPPTERCPSNNATELCPDVEWPRNATHALPRPQPPAFYKLSIRGLNSFIHVVEMEPTDAADYFVFTAVLIEAGKAVLAVHVDFEGCEGRDMLGLNPVDWIVFQESLIVQNTHSNEEAIRMEPFLYSNTTDNRFGGCRRIVNLKLPVMYPLHVHTQRVMSQKPPRCDWSLLRGGWWLNKGMPVDFDTPCRPSRLRERTPYLMDLKLRSANKSETTSATANGFRHICFIGDSHLNRFWLNRAPPDVGSTMLSGGGIEFDGGRKWYRWSN